MIPTMVFAGSEDPIEILSQPDNITAEAGEEKTMSVAAENVASYQWQRSADGQTWSNIGTTNTNYRDVKTETLTIKVSKNTAAYDYRCALKNSAGTVYTDPASVTLQQLLEISQQPQNISGKSGDEKTMKVVATNASSYQWQRSSDDGETWSNISTTNVNYKDVKTSILTIKLSKNTAGFVYRCVVKNSENTVNSEAAAVTVILPVTIKTQPQNITAEAGEEKTMSVVAQNATSYQWQRSADAGETWSNISTTNTNYRDVKTDVLTIKVSKNTAGFVYRCVVKNAEFTENTEAATVTVAAPVQLVEITFQPQNISGKVGDMKRLTVDAKNATSYQWQRSADDGQTWSNISTTNTNYSNPKTKTLTVKINKTTAAYVYRCVVKNDASTVESDVVTVSILQSVTITAQPEGISGIAGEEKTMSVEASGAASYQWQRSADDGETWSNISTTNTNYKDAKTATLTIKISKNTAAYVYRCVVKNDAGDSVASDPAAVELNATVTLTLDANGGLIYGNPTVTRIKEQNSYFFNDTEDAPVREGYIFDGWCLDKDGLEPIGFSCLVTEDLTLYAAWEENTGCTVTFDANGGCFNNDSTISTLSYHLQPGDIAEQVFDTNEQFAVSKAGYILDDWYLDPECTRFIPLNYYEVTENVTFYAKWVEACTVTYNATDGLIDGESTYTKSVSRNGYIYSDMSPVPTSDTYAFEGWYFDAAYTEKMPFEYRVTESITLYAKWVEPISVTWNANGGLVQNWYTEECIAPTYTEFVVPNRYLDDYYRTASRDHYRFKGWFFDEDLTESVDFSEYIVTENVTLYAKWEYAYCVTWDGNGGYWYNDSEETTRVILVYPNQTVFEISDPLRENYAFAGWYYDAACTIEIDWSAAVTEDITIYAKWVDPVYVTWDGNGGFVETYPRVTRIYNQPCLQDSQVYSEYSAYRANYVFDGWYLNAECTGKRVNTYSYPVNGPVTFYAKWVDPVEVTWDGNGGYIWGESDYPTYVEWLGQGQTIYSKSAERENYAFAGWYYDQACTERVDFDDYVLTENVTFYAKWVDPVYVTWDGNGGTVNGKTSYVEPYASGTTLDSSYTAKRDGYVFFGWYLDPECTESVNTWYYTITENVTFYADWAEATYVTWDSNGGTIYNGKSTCKDIVGKNRILNYTFSASKAGYALEGWYLDEDCTERLDPYTYVVCGEETFYANWVEAVTVTWDANGGYFGEYSNVTTYEDSIAKNSTIPYTRDAEKTGYLLVGWCLDAAGEECIDVYEYVLSEDVTLYAKWEKAVSVTWNANGGYIWGNEDYPTYMEYVRKNQAIGYRQTASKDGYAFGGWYLDEDFMESVDPQYYAPSGDVTFYAKWVEAVYVTWDANDGYIWGNEDYPTYTEPVAKNQRIGYTQSIEREGFDFVGWYLDEDCTESVDPEDYVPETDVTFYAKWREIKDVTVTFDANGGIYRSSSKVSYTLGYDRYVSELFEEDERFYQTVLRDGYYFEDWYLDADCTESVDVWDYRAVEDVTFYAKWVEAAHVTWNANGGYFSLDGGGTAATMTVNARPGYPIGEYPVPEREGYSFDGWYLDAYYSESVDTWWYDVYEDVTLYAKWADNVNVTLDANGGYFGGDPESTTIRTSAKQYSYFVVGDYNTPEREGYVFVGWYLEPDFMTRVYYEYYICEETTLYAKWAEAVYITWNGNGGYYLGDTSSPTYTTPVAKDEVLKSYCNFLKENYVLDGWCLDANCTESVDIYEYVPSQNVTFYAKWVEAVTVTWDANGGYFWPEASDPVSTQMAMVGKGRSVNEYLTPHRTDYEFVGWYLDADCTEEVDVWNYPVNQDVTFYAKWVEPVYATVTWDANGGYYWWNEYAQIYEEYVLVNNTPNSVSVYRPGYSFVGWCLDEECTETVDWWNYTVTGDVTFYAKWAETAVVTWNGNGGYIFGDSDYPEYVELCSKDDAIGHVVSVERENYRLDGWYLDAACTESVDPQTYVPTTDVEFFAKWIPIND